MFSETLCGCEHFITAFVHIGGLICSVFCALERKCIVLFSQQLVDQMLFLCGIKHLGFTSWTVLCRWYMLTIMVKLYHMIS